MEIIEIIIFILLFLNLTYHTFFFILISYGFFIYYKENKHLLIMNPHTFNIFFVFLIIVCEGLNIYFRFSLIQLTNNEIFQYIYNKLNIVNNYYLKIKNNFISYSFIKLKLMFNYFTEKPIDKIKINKKICKIKSAEDGLIFLNSLKST